MKTRFSLTSVVIYSILILLTCSVNSILAQDENKELWTAEGKEIRLVDEPGEIVAKLGNGLTVVIRENHSAPVAAVRLHVRAGQHIRG